MGATHLSALQAGSVTVNPSSIPATTRGSVDVTINGIAPGDLIVLYPPNTLEDDLLYVGHRIVGANTLRIYLYNPTAAAIDGASLAWDFVWFDRT